MAPISAHLVRAINNQIKNAEMPIVVNHVEWSQTDDDVVIKIPRQSSCARNADILITGTFVKVNFQPYLFETVLEHEICPDASVCKILENCIKFVLRKRDPIHWTNYASTEQTTKSADGVKLKIEAVEEQQKALAAETKERQRLIQNDKKANIERELKREQDIRDQVQRIHEQVKENVRKQPAVKAIVQQPSAHVEKAKAPIARVQKVKPDSRPEPPPIRSGGTINVSFTARRFVTPQRESQEHEEREWCLKQDQVRRDIGFCDDDLNDDERNPRWLLDKGKEFYAKKNYLAAISAFSAGIKLAQCPAVLLLHRAMAHFKVENYSRCVSCVQLDKNDRQANWNTLFIPGHRCFPSARTLHPSCQIEST